MYLYFDNSATLKEIFTVQPSRQGSSDWNTIHSYWDSTNGTITGVSIRYARPNVNIFDNNIVSVEYASDSDGEAQIPYDKNHDTKFFKYFTNYYFYNFIIPDEVLAVSGPVIATIYYTINVDGVTSRVAMGYFTFNVDANATEKVPYDDYISVSQWNYLINRLNNIESHYFIGDHTIDGDFYTKNIYPTAEDTYDIGQSGGNWYAHVYSSNFTGYNSNIEYMSATEINTTELNSTGITTYTFSVSGNVASDLIPSGTRNLGSSTANWTNGYISNIYANSINVSNASITGLNAQFIVSNLVPSNAELDIGAVGNLWRNVYARTGNYTTITTTNLNATTFTLYSGTFTSIARFNAALTDGVNSVTIAEIRTMLDLLGTDSQPYIDTIQEVLQAFENLPEGFNIAQAFALKFDKTNVVTAYSDQNIQSDEYVMSALLTYTKLQELFGFFTNGIANYANADASGNEFSTTYLKYSDLAIVGGFVYSINGTPVAQNVNVNGQPIAVSSVAEMVDNTKLYLLLTDGYVYYYNGTIWTQATQYLGETLEFATNTDIDGLFA